MGGSIVIITDAGHETCPAYKGDCTAQGLDCGLGTDGCGNVLDCGSCPAGQTCGATNLPNVCVTTCTPKTCADQGFDCGAATDTCGNVIMCGTCAAGLNCGANNMPNQCGTAKCVQLTCADQGFDCGMQGDTCGNIIDCGTCAAGQICGAGNPPTPGVCGTPPCVSQSCAQQGFNCGMATDGCNNVISCGTCTGNDICGGAAPNMCGSGPCTGLCFQQTTCPMMGTTSVSGTVYAPNGTDPLYNVLVYVPNGGPPPAYGVQPFAAGVTCGACGAEVTGSPLVSTSTAVDGTFTLPNMPVGQNIPLVIQNGRWRRKITIPNVPACTNTVLTAAQLRMPTKEAEGDPADNIPLMGFVTGQVDALECVLRKIGIADSEFSDPATQGGQGRVRFYLGELQQGAEYSGATPSASQLWGTQAEINQYDMVYFACQGTPGPPEPPASAKQIVVNYANAGGRVFATHFSYVWLYDAAPFSSTAVWQVNQGQPTPDPQVGYVNQSFPRGMALAQWLQIVGASNTLGQIQINTLRRDFNNVVAPSLLWISLGGTPIPPGNVPMHYTFDTPVGNPPAQQCGRVLFDDFHVENVNDSGGEIFPHECATGPMTPQEKLLEFMIFDLGSCVAPPTCTPKTCTQAGAQCGAIGDGCGNILNCGMCPANQVCVGNQCLGCAPKTCAQQGFMCGMQGDGCGDAIDCGPCPPNETCINGTCTVGTCTAKTCAQENAMCGSIGDTCGGIVDCGNCPAGQICGGCGTPNQCCKPVCTPKTCAQQGFNCGAATDGCGNTIMCGTCTGVMICGGCGNPNVCCGAG
jgi:hypothetical protein